jgi:hypothetical protein
LVGLWLVVAAPHAAHAQDIAAAEALFDKGVADMKAGRYEAGCKAIAESQRLDPRPGTLFTLATCEAQWGRIATAVSRYGDYLAVYERLPDDKQAAQAERFKVATEMRRKLGPEVPKLTLSLPSGAPAGTVVRRDGEVVAEAAFGVALPVDPGEHVLYTQAPGGPAVERRVTLAKGETKVVTLEVQAAEVGPLASPSAAAPLSLSSGAPPAGEQAQQGPSGRRIAAYVVGSVGLAGLAAGGVMGGVAVAQRGIMDQHCGAAIGQKDPTACDRTGLDAAGTAKTAATGSTIGLAAGGVLAVTGLVLFFTEPRSGPHPRGGTAAQPGSGWVSAGVLSAGPGGAVVGARGEW